MNQPFTLTPSYFKCYQFNSRHDQKPKVHKTASYIFFPETPQDLRIRANNTLISSRKAGHIVPIVIVPVGHIWKFDLEQHKKHDLG